MRYLKLFVYIASLFLALTSSAQAQLPGFPVELIPGPDATGVPVDTCVVVVGTGSSWASQMTVTLRRQDGQAVETRRESGGIDDIYKPAEPLQPLTSYTIRVEPHPSLGAPFESGFTTGAGPAEDPPGVAAFDPASGTVGVPLFGPFHVRFNRPVRNTSARPLQQAIRVVDRLGQMTGIAVTLAADGLSAQIALVNTWTMPTLHRILVDPEKLLDRTGVGGRGPVQEGILLTALAPGTGFEVLTAYPGDGAEDVPANVRPQVLFNRQAWTGITGEVGQVTCGDNRIPAQVEFRAMGRVLGLNLSQLLPPRTRCRWTIPAGVTDMHGIPAPEFSAEFTTGAGPDIRRGFLIESSPASHQTVPAPANAWPRLRFNKPVHPVSALLAAEFTGAVNGVMEAVEAEVEFFAEGTGVLFRPRAPLKPKVVYQLGAGNLRSNVWDLGGESLSVSDYNLRYRESADEQPPVLTMTLPLPDAQDVHPGTAIVLGFSEEMGAALVQEPVTITGAGEKVAAQFVRTPRSIRLNPDQLLKPDTMYEVQVRGLADLAGNPLPDRSFTFRTAASAAAAPAFNPVSYEPASSAVDVDPGTSIRLHFNLPVGGVLPGGVLAISGHTSPGLAFRTSVDGSMVEIIPEERLPVGVQISLSLTVLDQQARSHSLWLQFKTLDAQGGTFHVMSITPEPGVVAVRQDLELTFDFQEPVNPLTLNSRNLLVDDGSPRLNFTPSFSDDYRSATIVVPGAAPVKVFASDGIRSMSGAALEPRFFEYWPQPEPAGLLNYGGRPASRPVQGSPIEPGDPFTVFLDAPIDPAGVERWALVTADGVPWPGEFEVGALGFTLTFRPARDFPPSSRVVLFERWRLESLRTLAEFVTAAAVPDLRHSVDALTPLPRLPMLDFEFPLPADPGIVRFSLRTSPGLQAPTEVPLRVSNRGERILRVIPEIPLDDGNYQIAVSGADSAGWPLGFFGTFQVRHRPDARPVTLRVAPPPGSSNLPLNSLVSLLFDESVNRVTVNRRTLRLMEDDREIPVRIEFVNAAGVRLIPLVALRPETGYRVVMEGVEDMQGRPVEPVDWTFHTGRNLDFQPPQISSSAVPALGGYRLLAPDAPVTIDSSEALDPVAAVLENSWFHEPWDATVADDLLSAVYTPASIRDRGAALALSLRGLRDLSGNVSSSTYFPYSTAIAEDAEPPRLLDFFPSGGTRDVLVNAQITIRFDEPVDAGSIAGIRLSRDGERIRLIPQVGPQNMLQLRPERMLVPGAEYSLVVEGVRDIWGNPMDGRNQAAFQTGARADAAPTVCQGPGSTTLPANARITLSFSKPMSPPTVLNGLSLHRLVEGSGGMYAPVPAGILLAADGLGATLVPETPLEPRQVYRITGAGLRDFAGTGCADTLQTSWSFTAAAEAHDPPRVTAVPPNGATDVPRNALAGVVFDRPMPRRPDAPVRLFCDNDEIRLLEQSSSPLLFSRASGILPRGAACRMDVDAFEDFAGNRSAPFSTSFTVADAAASDLTRPQLLSTTPASGEVGVNPASPVRLGFSKLMRQPWSLSPEVEMQATGLQWRFTGTAAADGRDVFLNPNPAWPAATRISISLRQTVSSVPASLADLAGNRVDRLYQLSFHTAALPDSEPPRLEWVSPGSGGSLRAMDTRFVLQFSEPVILKPGALSLFAGTSALSATATLSEDARRIELAAQIPPNSTISLLLGDLITDLAGNPLAARQFTWTSLDAEGYGQPQVNTVNPENHRQVQSGDLEISLDFSRPMNVPTTTAAFRVMEDGEWIGGTVTLNPSGRQLRYKPDRPFQPGARVDVFLLSTALSIDGVPLHQSFVSRFYVAAGAGPTAFEVVRKYVVAEEEVGRPVLEIEFSRPLDPASVNGETVWARIGSRRVHGVLSLEHGRLLRFRADEPLPEDEAIVLTAGASLTALDGEPFAGRDFHFTSADLVHEAELEAVDEAADGAIRLRFVAPVSSGMRFKAGLDGVDNLWDRFHWSESADRREWRLIPIAPKEPEPLSLQFKGKTVLRTAPAPEQEVKDQ